MMKSYSLNFVFSIRELESARVKLTPFIPALHAEEFVKQTNTYPELMKYVAVEPFGSVNEFVDKLYEKRLQQDRGIVIFAILDKTAAAAPRFAGVIGLVNSSEVDQCTEIGFVVTFPEFQRTHVTSNAVGLLLHYCLDLPASDTGKDEFRYGPGLGLRRVQWETNAENVGSARTAERMGFRHEGIIRWQIVLPEGKYGLDVPAQRQALCAARGRHTRMLSLCWDDWELEGAREVVQQQMDRL